MHRMEERAEIRRKLWAHNPHMLDPEKRTPTQETQKQALKAGIGVVNWVRTLVRSLTTEQDKD